jgi:O-Antigen ligase/Tetratricopeptide repeat
VLAGAVLSVSVAVPIQSREAMVAMLASIPVFFLFSGQRLRGLLALAPITAALLVVFPDLNGVYLAFLNQGDPAAVLDRVVPAVWVAAAGAGLYGLLWGLIDQRWRPSVDTVRAVGSVVLAGSIVAIVLTTLAFTERTGNPVVWGEQKWEAFKADDHAGQEQSRYLSASGTGRYTLWKVAWEDFVSHPVLGVGTHNYEATYYRLRETSAGHVRQPHTLPLEVLSERGIVGGVLFFGFLATCLATGLTQRFRRLNAEGRAQVGAVIAAVTYWFVHSSAEWFWQMPAVTIPAIVFLALLVAPWEQQEVVPSPPRPLRAVAAGVAVLAIVVVTPLYLADRLVAQSEAADNPRAGLRYIELAQRFNPTDPSLAQREGELALQTGGWPRAEHSYSQAIRLDPENYAPYYLYARFREKSGDYEEALRLYRKALSLDPLNEKVGGRLSQLEDRR